MNSIINRKTQIIQLGLIDYQKAWDYQDSLFSEILKTKKENRTRPAHQQLQTSNHLIFCEHPHVFTLGKSGDETNLKISREALPSVQAGYIHTNRGGDITYHGPGQLIGYPVLDLENFFTDIHRYMRSLEEAVIQTLGEFGIMAGRIPGLTGVWLDEHNPGKARKICALGVKTSRWVTLHGFALNVNTNLKYFEYIVPCGIHDKAVTSMANELHAQQNMEQVTSVLKEKLRQVFELEWV